MKNTLGLGDRVKQALSVIGVTEERLSRWLGVECGCAERQEKLNQLGRWASRVLGGRVERAKEHLEEITRE